MPHAVVLPAGTPTAIVQRLNREIDAVAREPGPDTLEGLLDAVEVLLDDGCLTIRGEKSSATEDKDKQFSEHFYGKFERRIPLDVAVAADQVSASFKNGVLTVTLPFREEAKPRTINVEVAA